MKCVSLDHIQICLRSSWFRFYLLPGDVVLGLAKVAIFGGKGNSDRTAVSGSSKKRGTLLTHEDTRSIMETCPCLFKYSLCLCSIASVRTTLLSAVYA